jgi:hypothetical protein
MEVVGVNGRVGDAVDGVVLATLYRSDPALRSDDNLLLLRRLLLRTLLDAIRRLSLVGADVPKREDSTTRRQDQAVPLGNEHSARVRSRALTTQHRRRRVHLSGDQLELGLLVWQVKAHLQVLASLEIDEASLQVNVLLVPRLVAVFLPHGWV